MILQANSANGANVTIIRSTGSPQEIIDRYNKVRDQFRVTCSKDGNTYIDAFAAPGVPPSEERFKLGVEFDCIDLVGNPCKVSFL